MKALLSQVQSVIYHYVDGKRVEGKHELITGDVSGITGDVSDIYGDVSDIYGNMSGITGDVSGITGDVSGISGDVYECEITDEERENGIDIKQLINTTTKE